MPRPFVRQPDRPLCQLLRSNWRPSGRSAAWWRSPRARSRPRRPFLTSRVGQARWLWRRRIR